jgi:hypothetical protein
LLHLAQTAVAAGTQVKSTQKKAEANAVGKSTTKHIKDWSVDEVADYLARLSLADAAVGVRTNCVDGKTLLDLTDKDLKEELGLTTLQVKRLRLEIKSMAGISGEATGTTPQADTPSAAQSAAAVVRPKRWGDGIEAPAAGTRHFVPPGFEVKRDVEQSIAMFGHSSAHVAVIMEAGRSKAASSPFSLAAAYAGAIYAYTEETPLYGTLNYTMRTPHTQKTPTDTQLEFFADYIVHSERALNCLPTHVSEKDGAIYRGIKVLLSKDLYSPGKQFTWQAFSSATSKQTATLEFVQVLPGRKLLGSLFVIHSITAKDIRHFSAFPSEEEVLFPSNSQFKVERVVTSVQDKAALLTELTAYDLSDLDVYVIKQVA